MGGVEYPSFNYFNPDKEINKYELDHSTFDLIDVDKFKNTKATTVFWYLVTWILMILSWIWLGSDIYTCLNILVFHHWSSQEYKPYAYSTAKWIFTGCIIFQFCLLLYHWIWAIHTYRTRNIALAYVNSIARLLYIVRSYNYFCLFNSIEQDNFFDWCCFLCYNELDNALQMLVADTPRQVINILTLRYYATDRESSNDIINNIKNIATTNLTLAIILSIMCLSVAIWSIFFFKFVFGMILYIPIKVKLREREFKSLKKYCCSIVNENVRVLVYKHHKPKKELLERGIVGLKEIAENPLLNSSTTTFDNGSEYRGIAQYNNNIRKPSAIHKVNDDYPHNDNKKLYSIVNDSQSYESLRLDDLQSKRSYKVSKINQIYNRDTSPSSSIRNPFNDSNLFDSNDNIHYTISGSQDLSTLSNTTSATNSRNLPSTASLKSNPFATDSEIFINGSRKLSGYSSFNSNKRLASQDSKKIYYSAPNPTNQEQERKPSPSSSFYPSSTIQSERKRSQSSLTYDKEKVQSIQHHQDPQSSLTYNENIEQSSIYNRSELTRQHLQSSYNQPPFIQKQPSEVHPMSLAQSEIKNQNSEEPLNPKLQLRERQDSSSSLTSDYTAPLLVPERTSSIDSTAANSNNSAPYPFRGVSIYDEEYSYKEQIRDNFVKDHS